MDEDIVEKKKNRITKHLTLDDRIIIERLLKEGRTITYISKQINRTMPCITIEVNRIGRLGYCANKANDIANSIKEKRGFNAINNISLNKRLLLVEKYIEEQKKKNGIE